MALKFHESPFHATEDHDVASNMVLRADITIMIRDIVERQGWNQTQAAKELGISQPRMSDIMNGKIDKFTLDFLVTILDKLGFRARFTFGDLDSAEIKINRATKTI